MTGTAPWCRWSWVCCFLPWLLMHGHGGNGRSVGAILGLSARWAYQHCNAHLVAASLRGARQKCVPAYVVAAAHKNLFTVAAKLASPCHSVHR